MRQRVVDELGRLLDRDERVAVVLAAISASLFEPLSARHPKRVINVGIREQALIGVTAGLASTGLRPVAHTYAPFLLERPFEQLKVDLCHQGLGAVLVSIGASYDSPEYGTTHFCPEDVALLDALPGVEVHVPGHPDEAAALLLQAAAGSGISYLRLSEASNKVAHPATAGRLLPLRHGRRGTVVAVGPLLDQTVEAVADLDVTLVYANSVRPLDEHTLLATLGEPAVVLVEPYLAGTSVAAVSHAIRHVPHRILGLGVGRADLHRYGTRSEHDLVHGLDAASLRTTIGAFLAPAACR
ncbi:MAG: transketolase family protein [Candidatus Dormibacteria bacterium]